jgi:hypothetical protein
MLLARSDMNFAMCLRPSLATARLVVREGAIVVQTAAAGAVQRSSTNNGAAVWLAPDRSLQF